MGQLDRSSPLARAFGGGAFDSMLDRVRRVCPFEGFAVGRTPGRDRANPFVADNWPADFRAYYLAHRWHAHSAFGAALARGEDVVTEVDIEIASRDDPVMRSRREAVIEATGGACVVAVPVRDRGCVAGSVALARREPFSPRECEIATIVAPAVFAAAMAAPGPGPVTGTLTSRESECLGFAADGKTAWEIGRILDLSENTVASHLAAATRKLGAATRTHAVAEALRRGLID